jgi:hypothetical protein
MAEWLAARVAMQIWAFCALPLRRTGGGQPVEPVR